MGLEQHQQSIDVALIQETHWRNEGSRDFETGPWNVLTTGCSAKDSKAGLAVLVHKRMGRAEMLSARTLIQGRIQRVRIHQGVNSTDIINVYRGGALLGLLLPGWTTPRCLSSDRGGPECGWRVASALPLRTFSGAPREQLSGRTTKQEGQAACQANKTGRQGSRPRPPPGADRERSDHAGVAIEPHQAGDIPHTAPSTTRARSRAQGNMYGGRRRTGRATSSVGPQSGRSSGRSPHTFPKGTRS